MDLSALREKEQQAPGMLGALLFQENSMLANARLVVPPCMRAQPPVVETHMPLASPTETQVPPASPTETQVPPASPTEAQVPPASPTEAQVPPVSPTEAQVPPASSTEAQVPPASPTETQVPPASPTEAQVLAESSPELIEDSFYVATIESAVETPKVPVPALVTPQTPPAGSCATLDVGSHTTALLEVMEHNDVPQQELPPVTSSSQVYVLPFVAHDNGYWGVYASLQYDNQFYKKEQLMDQMYPSPQGATDALCRFLKWPLKNVYELIAGLKESAPAGHKFHVEILYEGETVSSLDL